jgi:hypothetical protein
MLIQSIDYVGTRETPPRQVCAALGLWCYGEYWNAAKQNDYENAANMLHQAASVLAEAEWYRGKEEQESTTRRAISKRHRDSAIKGYEANRQRKLHAFDIWSSREWKPQADAERTIARDCCITQAVAGRWIREFKRAPDAYRAMQSKHSALQRP